MSAMAVFSGGQVSGRMGSKCRDVGPCGTGIYLRVTGAAAHVKYLGAMIDDDGAARTSHLSTTDSGCFLDSSLFQHVCSHQLSRKKNSECTIILYGIRAITVMRGE